MSASEGSMGSHGEVTVTLFSDMSSLRWLGLLAGVVLCLSSFARFRTFRMRRFDFLVGVVGGTALVIASLYPPAVDGLRAMMMLEDAQFSRLLALSVLSSLALWFLWLRERGKREEDRSRFDFLVRHLAVSQFQQDHPSFGQLPPILVVMPAYNEADNLPDVLTALPDQVDGKALAAVVIDDGSDDGSAEVAGRFQVPVARSPVRRGGGAALRIGFDIAVAGHAEIIVTMDADGQHLPGEIADMVAPILAGQADVVIGSRLLGRHRGSQAVRLAGIHLFNRVIAILTPLKVTDCSNGFRAIRVPLLKRLIIRQDQYHTTEFLIEAARAGARIQDVPITVEPRLHGSSKKGRNWLYGLRFAKTILKTWWRRP